MKTTLSSLLAGLVLAAPALAQKTGDAVVPDALGKIEWVRGTAPATWEPGKLYILECWATWCGPCLAVIPHMDGLYDKYESKGLRVIGVNVWEDGKDKVEKFLKDKGDGMSYPVAYTGKGGVFETEWLKKAEVKGIPHAFVVKDGKVLFTTHPAQLSEAVIEDLLAGGDREAKAVSTIGQAAKEREVLGNLMTDFQKAAAAKDTEAMTKAYEALKPLKAAAATLPRLELDLLIAKADWAGAEASLAKIPEGPMRASVLAGTAQRASRSGDIPEAFRRVVATQLDAAQKENANPMILQILSRLQWSTGDKDTAIASGKRAVEAANATEGKMKIPSAAFERWVEALEKGEAPDEKTFSGWLRDSVPKPTAKPAAKTD